MVMQQQRPPIFVIFSSWSTNIQQVQTYNSYMISNALNWLHLSPSLGTWAAPPSTREKWWIRLQLIAVDLRLIDQSDSHTPSETPRESTSGSSRMIMLPRVLLVDDMFDTHRTHQYRRVPTNTDGYPSIPTGTHQYRRVPINTDGYPSIPTGTPHGTPSHIWKIKYVGLLRKPTFSKYDVLALPHPSKILWN